MGAMATPPWPHQWIRPALGGWVGVVFCTVAWLFIAPAATVAAVALGSARSAGLAAWVTAVFLPFAWHVKPRRPEPVGPPVRVDVAGVPSWGVRFPVRTIGLPVTVAFFVCGLTVAFLAGGVAGRVSAAERVPLAVVSAVFVTGFVGLGLFGLMAWRRHDAIELTPSHLVLGLGRHPLVLEWDRVARIGAAGRSQDRIGRRLGVRAVPNCIVVEASPDDLPELVGAAGVRWRRVLDEFGMLGVLGASSGLVTVASAGRLVNDPVLVYRGLRFYLHHPELRHELADGTAPVRLEAGRLVE